VLLHIDVTVLPLALDWILWGAAVIVGVIGLVKLRRGRKRL
jgi:hypothetical protein